MGNAGQGRAEPTAQPRALGRRSRGGFGNGGVVFFFLPFFSAGSRAPGRRAGTAGWENFPSAPGKFSCIKESGSRLNPFVVVSFFKREKINSLGADIYRRHHPLPDIWAHPPRSSEFLLLTHPAVPDQMRTDWAALPSAVGLPPISAMVKINEASRDARGGAGAEAGSPVARSRSDFLVFGFHPAGLWSEVRREPGDRLYRAFAQRWVLGGNSTAPAPCLAEPQGLLQKERKFF